MPNSKYFLSLLFLFTFFSLFLAGNNTVKSETGTTWDSRRLEYRTDVVVDVDSKTGAMADLCMSMALSDFYAKHPSYKTRLSLQRWDSPDDFLAASSEYASKPSASATFAIKLGEISSASQSSYLIRTALADFSRLARVTVAILENLGRNEVILVYEDNESGNAIVPYFTDALASMDIQLSNKIAIPTSAEDFHILEELKVIMSMQSMVFVVHTTNTTLASHLFVHANKAGMMSEGSPWLLINGLPSFVDTMDPIAINSMKGVIGVRPFVPKTKALKNFKTRYKRLSLMKQKKEASELNLFGLLAYDTIWALAITVERIGTVMKGKKDKISAAEEGSRKILEEILMSTSFRGISGDFDLVNGQLQPSTFEIFNLRTKGERKTSRWIATDFGWDKNNGRTRRTLSEWSMPAVGDKWRIGIPSKTGFSEFVNIHPDPDGNKKSNEDELKGFSIEVFEAVWKDLALPSTSNFEFVSVDGTYDELCCQVKDKKIDAAVGDISIVASRTNCVDFTLPYLESGVRMLIKVSHDGPKDMWIFLKPLSWDLWLTIIVICIFIGIVVRVLERRENTQFSGSARKQLSTILMFPCLSIATPQRDMVVTNCSRMVLVIWIFLAFVLMQSYTANLSSILTLNQLQPTIPSLRVLRKSHVGYQNHSFVKDLLISQLEFEESMLKPYDSVDDYQEALSKGSDNGGVAAIFDEIPHIKIFLAKYTTGFIMVGPTYRTDGLGFAFSIGSPLVASVSRAILNFTEGKYMSPIEKKYFGRISIDQEQTGPVSSISPSLSTKSFAGLFMIIGIVVLLAVLVSENHLLGRLVRRYIFCNPHDVLGSRVQPSAEAEMTITNNIHPENNNQENQNSDQISNRVESIEETTSEVHSP